MKHLALLTLLITSVPLTGQLTIDQVDRQTLYLSEYDNLTIFDSGGENGSYSSNENFSFQVCVYECEFDNLPKIIAQVSDIDINSSFTHLVSLAEYFGLTLRLIAV